MTHNHSFREKLHKIIFETDTNAGHQFDLMVTWLIVLSIVTVILETVSQIGASYQAIFHKIELAVTFLFSIEYMLRIYAAKNRWKYVTSFFGITDLLAIIPSYIGIFIPGNQNLLIIRILRLLRIFRIFELKHFVSEGAIVASALRASRTKIIVFVAFVGIATILMGTFMYLLENHENPSISNIPEGIYWAVVTITTVGYGDSIPITTLGKILASLVMILGYGVIAVPIGIVTAEITNRVLGRDHIEKKECPNCGNKTHLRHSGYCHHCGEPLIG